MIVWVLNALLIGLLLGYLVAERLSGGLEVVFARAVYPNERTFGVQVRAVRST